MSEFNLSNVFHCIHSVYENPEYYLDKRKAKVIVTKTIQMHKFMDTCKTLFFMYCFPNLGLFSFVKIFEVFKISAIQINNK